MSILRKYAATTTIDFPLISYNSVSFTSTASLTTADVRVMLNEGAIADIATTPVNEGSFGYSVTMTTGELTAARVVMLIHHTAAAPVFEDSCILIETYGNASAQHGFDLNVANQVVIASAGTVTVSAGTVTSVTNNVTISTASLVIAGTVNDKTGYSLTQTFPTNFADLSVSATTGGVKLQASQAVIASAGTVNISAAAVSSVWGVAATEPVAPPAITATMVESISWLLSLSRNKITQTATLQTLFADNTANTIATSTVSDDGTTFTRAEFTI